MNTKICQRAEKHVHLFVWAAVHVCERMYSYVRFADVLWWGAVQTKPLMWTAFHCVHWYACKYLVDFFCFFWYHYWILVVWFFIFQSFHSCQVQKLKFESFVHVAILILVGDWHLVFRNRLESLPEWIGECHFLHTINVSHNLLTQLPQRFVRLELSYWNAYLSLK